MEPQWTRRYAALVGLAMLTRLNSVTLLCLSILPWVSRPPRSSRTAGTCCAAWMLGLAMPLAIWIVAAGCTGSDLLPRSNYSNLAMTYFGSGDRISGESRIAVEQQFDSLLDVIIHDPAHLALSYARDLVSVPSQLLKSRSISWLVAIVAVASLSTRSLRSRKVLVFVAATALQAALINLKTFEPRYWLFLEADQYNVAPVAIKEFRL